MKDLKVIFMGTPEFSLNILQNLIDNTNVIAVFSQPDKIVGRKKVLTKTPTKILAESYNIPVYQPLKVQDDFDIINELNPDIIITCAYGQFIPKNILDIPKYKCINVHASLLPKLRGGAPIHWAIINGYKETGITIMYMDPKMDAGNIIKTSSIEIEDTDTYRTLHDKLSPIGATLLIETLPSIIDGSNDSIEQNIDEITIGYNIKREEEYLDFNDTVLNIYNKIRGLNDSPYACFILNDLEFKAIESKIGDSKKEGSNGEIINIYKNGIGIKVSDGEIILTKIKPFSKNIMDVSSYLNGINKEELLKTICK